MREIKGVGLAPNWTTAAGAVEGVLEYLGLPLPRHAIMGLTGHAWHLCVTEREGVHVLPDGPVTLEWGAMVEGYARTGVSWERHAARLEPGGDRVRKRERAVEWAIERLDGGVPVVGWDLQLHEFGIIYGYDRDRQAFLVHSITSGELGPLLPWREWPSDIGWIELFAPVGEVEADPVEAVLESLRVGVSMMRGESAGAGVRGLAAYEVWADWMDAEDEIDRAGNAYTLAVLQAARADGADYLHDVAGTLPDLAGPLGVASRALREVGSALAPLITLFPFPAGGHGNIANPGLRRAAAMALRRAGRHEREAADALEEAAAALR